MGSVKLSQPKTWLLLEPAVLLGLGLLNIETSRRLQRGLEDWAQLG